MFKKVLIILGILLVVMILPMGVYSQVQKVSRIIVWNKPVTAQVSGRIVKNISFDGAIYIENQPLPVWSENVFMDKLSETANLSDCVYLPLTAEELALIGDSADQISSDIGVTVSKIMSRKQAGSHIEILPFKRDLLTGQILKLVSFSIQFTENKSAEKVSAKSYAATSVLSQGNWYKLAVTQTGIYRIEYNDLVSMGINPATLNPAQIGIFGIGGKMLPEANAQFRYDDLPENAIEVTGQADGHFDNGDQILFYAQGPDSWQYNSPKKIWEHTTHLYSDTICYFLTTDQGSGKRIQVKSNSIQAETDVVDSYDYFTRFEENNFNLIKSGRQWFSQVFDVILTRSYSFDVPELATAGEVSVRSVTAAKSINASSFEFTIGGQSWTASHLPVSTYDNSPVATGNTAYKTLQSVSLPIKIDVRYIRTAPSAAGYLDLLDINARCKLKFVNGQLDFRDSKSFGPGRTALYHLANAAGKVRLWDVTNPVQAGSVTTSASGNDLVFKLASDSIRQFVAFDESKYLKPRFVTKIQNQNLHASAGADLVIIAPQVFMSQAVRLATFHSTANDLNVLVLDPVTIYNEFSSGTTDITAIRDFLKMLYDKAGTVNMPKYLLLFGDGSYDYKDVMPSNTNFVPSWQSPESYDPIKSLVTDDYFGTLDDNEGTSYADIIDIGIGRLPVKTPLEAEQAVDKILHYTIPSGANMGDWRTIITFVADDEDAEHIEHSEIMANNIETNNPEINLDKIYLDSYIQIATSGGNRYPDVNKAITQRVEKGSLILNYTGHGGETGWAHEQVLTVSEINNWSNFDNLPVFVTATCEFSRFDDPGRVSAGEMVLTNPKGGGIASFTTTRPTYGTPNFELNKKFYQYALSRPGGQRLRMGDIIMNSKRDKGSNENGRKYVLLGDPALQIAFPGLNVVTTFINGQVPGHGSDTLKASKEINIEGMIVDDKGQLVSDFNGTVFPSVFDKALSQKTLANDGGSIYSYFLQKNLLYKGKVNVEGGKFSFTFIVPKDIAYRYDYGKISYYATDGTRDASGENKEIVVGGSDESGLSENTGPEISLYMNSLSFHDGGITDQNPRLLAVVSDENGINTIGNGIGHDITAVLDGNTAVPYILNDFYESDINTYKSGYIMFPFSMLSPGEHSLTVKVWDVFNNSSESEIHFLVQSSGEFIVLNAYNYPNPFQEYTDIVFEHNQQDVDFTIHAEIYSLSGQLVRVIEQTSAQSGSVSTPVRWDGRNGQGSAVPSGMYIYSLKVSTSNGLNSQISGKLILHKY